MSSLEFNNATEIIEYYYAAIGDERHEIAELVIEKYKNSSNGYDLLGVAIAYMWQGAKYRANAIEYFEQLINNYDLKSLNTQIINEWSIYSDLANLYEKEYEFQKAISCLQKCIEADNGTNPADYTRTGDLLVKMDVEKAEEYYLKLLNDNSLKQYERSFAIALDDVLDKKRKGYVFKPRKKKANI